MDTSPTDPATTKDRLLICIRGNSGSGKTSIARRLREEFQRRELAIIGQDVVRRDILRERDTAGAANIDLIAITASFALSRGFHCVLEGILDAGRYGAMLDRLHKEHQGPQYWYYIDLPFEETLARHASRPLSATVTAEEMAQWYRPCDVLPDGRERVIDHTSTLEDTVQRILVDTALLTR